MNSDNVRKLTLEEAAIQQLFGCNNEEILKASEVLNLLNEEEKEAENQILVANNTNLTEEERGKARDQYIQTMVEVSTNRLSSMEKLLGITRDD